MSIVEKCSTTDLISNPTSLYFFKAYFFRLKQKSYCIISRDKGPGNQDSGNPHWVISRDEDPAKQEIQKSKEDENPRKTNLKAKVTSAQVNFSSLGGRKHMPTDHMISVRSATLVVTLCSVTFGFWPGRLQLVE